MKSSFKKTAAAGLVAITLLFGAGCSGGENARSTGQSVDDAAITAKVKAAFAKDPAVRAIDVKVDTFKGTVQLNGWVDSAADKTKAEEVAKTIPGVKAIDNKLSIKTER